MNDLTDVKVDGTNFQDGFLIQTDGDGSAPTFNNTLNSARGNVGIGASVFRDLTEGDYNVGFGFYALRTMTTGTRNVGIGYESLGNTTTSNYNVAIGFAAGNGMWNAADGNVAIGYQSMSGNNSADGIVSIGRQAGYNHTSGVGAVYLGYNAGKTNTTGARNIAIGYQAYDNADTESDNIAIGYDALGGPVAGAQYTTAIGNYSLDAITSGTQNTAVGHKAGTALTTGWGSTLLGYEAGAETTGSRNTLIGYRAGHYYTGGSDNIALGFQALNGSYGNSTGSNNISIGKSSSYNITTGSSNIAIGDNAGNNITTGSNNVVIGEADVPSATGSDQLSISSGDGGVTWITGASTGVVDFPNGLTNNGSAIESAFETITDVTIGSGTSGTTSGIYFGANNEAGVVAGEVSSASTANDGYIELMNMDLDAITGASGLQTIELTIQIEDETNGEVESFKALVQATEKTVLGTTARAVNFTEWAILFDGAARIGTLAADYDSSDDTIRIRYQNKQGSTATLTATFYAITMQNNT